ncbi:MAG: metallophosphoesterase [Limnohabitans sp.]|nr:metallophosphoesterase [Limnohabitans sp.]
MIGHWRNDATAFSTLLGRAAEVMRTSPYREGCVVRLPKRGTLLVTGDLHDSVEGLECAVRLARLTEGLDHSMVLHELIHSEHVTDGIDRSHRMLAMLAELILAHPLQVHPLLANHEIAQCRRQKISKSGVDSVDCFDAGLEWAFGDDADIAGAAVAAFIRAMPLAILCDNGLMVSHSLPAEGSMRWFDVRVLERALHDEDFDVPDGAAYLMTWGRNHAASQLATLAREWGVKTFVVGHTHVADGVAFRMPNLVVINSDHSSAKCIEVDVSQPIAAADVLARQAKPLLGGLGGLGAASEERDL